jgi:hypothetical protein
MTTIRKLEGLVRLRAAGTSEGVKKAWESRQRKGGGEGKGQKLGRPLTQDEKNLIEMAHGENEWAAHKNDVRHFNKIGHSQEALDHLNSYEKEQGMEPTDKESFMKRKLYPTVDDSSESDFADAAWHKK